MSSQSVLSGVVSSMTFNAAGDELWICHPSSGIEVLSWPAGELQRIVPVIAFFLCAHPTDPYFAALSHKEAFLLDPMGRVLRAWSIAGGQPLAAAFCEDTLQLLYSDHGKVVLWSCSWVDGAARQLSEILWVDGWLRWATLLPRKQMAIFTVQDGWPQIWRIAEQRIFSVDEWAPKINDSFSSWLSVDASLDERFVCWGNKKGYITLATLDEDGQVIHHTEDWLKGNRVASQAIHHLDEVALFLDIKGDVRWLPANREAVHKRPSFALTFPAGYRWG